MATVDYGSDLSCITDLSPTIGTVTGRTLLGEACLRRLTTHSGTLLDDPDYGIDVRNWLNDGMTSAQIRQLGAQIDNELLKDERVLGSKSDVSFVQGVLKISVRILDAGGPFTLTFSVSDASISNLSVT